MQDFDTFSGVPPFIFDFVHNNSGGNINENTGVYQAGSTGGVTDTVRVTDAESTTSEATILVIATPLLIEPKLITVEIGGTVDFDASGGEPAYSFSIADNQSDAIIDQDTGIYIAGLISGVTDTVEVTDTAFYTSFATVTVTAPELDRTDWVVHYVDSQEVNGEDAPAENAYDGDVTTYWHTQWQMENPNDPKPPHPHEIQIDLGAMYEIDGFHYLPHQDGSNGRIGLYEFFVSIDGTSGSWGSPLVTGFFPNTAMEQQVTFPQVSGRYVRLVALTEVNGEDFTTIAEFNVLGLPFSGNYAPNGVIDSPVDNPVISAGTGLEFLGTGADAETPAANLTYYWNFDDSGVGDMYIEDPGEIVFNIPGTYTVTLTVTDTNGRSDSTPAVQIINVLNGGGISIAPQDTWWLVSVNSEETVGEGPDNGRGWDAFDGDPDTYWHTQWKDGATLPPHQITIDLGSAYEVTGLRYLPRQDWYNTRIGDFQVYFSADGRNWGNSNAMGTFSDDYLEKTVRFMPEMAQFLRLVALNSIDGNPPISAAEIDVEGECNNPYVSIIDPQTNVLQQQSDAGLEMRASVCLKDGIHSGWGVKFVADGVSQQTVTLPPDGIIEKDTFMATFLGLSSDNHMIEAYIVDNAGDEVIGATTYDVVTSVGYGDYYVAIGDSITAGYADDVVSDNTSADGRNYGGGYTPILNNLLSTEKGYPHTVVNEAQNGEKTAEGLARLLSIVLDRHPYAGYFLIQYGTNDKLSNLPSGLGKSPGQSGYADSYKDLVQQMIYWVTESGKTALLAKLLYTGYPELNVSMQEYNLVIDELVSENGIQVMPPDFYNYF